MVLELETSWNETYNILTGNYKLSSIVGYIKSKIDDLNVLYGRKADLIINPVQLGGGLKIKNVEALANGLPLITTPEGANGLEDGINNAFLLANTTEEWIESIIAVMI